MDPARGRGLPEGCQGDARGARRARVVPEGQTQTRESARSRLQG